MDRLIAMLSMLVKENLVPGDLARAPEEPVMDSEAQVTAWHQQGADEGPILPVYHLNGLACSRFVPPGGTVIDLGCGTGRFAAYLARLRPDIQVIGFDLAQRMVDTGNVSLREEGLADRVELRLGSMTSFSRQAPADTAMVNCLFAIHHLPLISDVEQCLQEIRSVRDRTGCAFMIFDLARPRHQSTPTNYPRALTPGAPEAFQVDSINSLRAAYSHAELSGAVERVLGSIAKTIVSRYLPLYQAFWSADRQPERTATALGALPKWAARQHRALRSILPTFPA